MPVSYRLFRDIKICLHLLLVQKLFWSDLYTVVEERSRLLFFDTGDLILEREKHIGSHLFDCTELVVQLRRTDGKKHLICSVLVIFESTSRDDESLATEMYQIPRRLMLSKAKNLFYVRYRYMRYSMAES